MAEENKVEKTRRAVVTSAAQVAVTAPAVGLLLSASTMPAGAQTLAYATAKHILDDFTFGNDAEDIDARALGSNTNTRNGTVNLDDSVG